MADPLGAAIIGQQYGFFNQPYPVFFLTHRNVITCELCYVRGLL